jgi:DNA-binding NtrC family response regulator
VHEWRLRSSTSYLRDCVFERDRGVCALCGLDTVRLRRRIMRLPFPARMRELRALIERGTILRGRKTWWEADHIRPVVEGGDSNLENVRTLCIACHREVTRGLRMRRYTRVAMKSKVADELRREQFAKYQRMTPAERDLLALKLGEQTLADYMANTGLNRDEAKRRLKRAARAGRRPSASMDDERSTG